MSSMKFEEKIAMLCERKGWNQSRLAQSLAKASHKSISKNTVSRWFAGAVRPFDDWFLPLAETLGVDCDYLADDTLDEPPAPELSDDERRLLEIARTLQGGAQAALWRIVNFPGTIPPEGMPSTPTFHAMPIADRDLTASANQRSAERAKPKRSEKPEEVKKAK